MLFFCSANVKIFYYGEIAAYLQGKITSFNNMLMASLQSEPIRVLVTGAAGQIAYSLLYSIGNGSVFGKDQVWALTLKFMSK